MNVPKEARKLLDELGFENIDFYIEGKRVRFPDALCVTELSEKEKARGKENPYIQVRGNESSLVRMGLAYLIVHELSHYIYRLDHDFSPDEDYSPDFLNIEIRLRERLWNIILNE